MKLHCRSNRFPLKKLEKVPVGKSEKPPSPTRQANRLTDQRKSPFIIKCHSSTTTVVDTQLTLSLELMADELEQQPMTFSPWLELSNEGTLMVL